jgi:hypothetical protein
VKRWNPPRWSTVAPWIGPHVIVGATAKRQRQRLEAIERRLEQLEASPPRPRPDAERHRIEHRKRPAPGCPWCGT